MLLASPAERREIVLFCINQVALKAVLDAGFQLVADSQLMASEEFGCLERYLPGDESLF